MNMSRAVYKTQRPAHQTRLCGLLNGVSRPADVFWRTDRTMNDWGSLIIRTKEDLMEAVRTFGIVPFFPNTIKGFSIKEHADPAVWFTGADGPWE